MAISKTHIDVKVSVESIRDSLRKRIISENSMLITDVIINNLKNTEMGLEQLFNALSGIEDKISYKVGDHVMVEVDPLYTWKFSKEKSAEAGLFLNNRIRAQIMEINPYSKTPLNLIYDVVDNKGEYIKVESPVKIDQVCLEDDWPGEDLPF
jgi:hypothetical protein